MTDQSSEDPTQTGELGPMPAATSEPGETNPGGADAIPEPDEVIAADLEPGKNPAVDDSPEPVRSSLAQGEDTDTAATRGTGDTADTGDGSADPEDESPA